MVESISLYVASVSIYRPPFTSEGRGEADVFADLAFFFTLGRLNVTLTLLDTDGPAAGANVTFTVTPNDRFLASDRFAAELSLTLSEYDADFVADRVTFRIDDPATAIRPAAGTLTLNVADDPTTALTFETLTDTAEGEAPDALPDPRNITEPTTGGDAGGTGNRP